MDKRWLAAGALAMGAWGCGSSNSGSPEPTTCDRALVSGTYLMHFTTVSGTCGAIPDSLANFSSAGAASTCTVASQSVSDGNCRVDTVETCMSNGLRIDETAFVIIDAADGSRMHGEFTETLTGIGVACTGTYQVTYARQ